jgi:putative ABC transport system permease protein
MTSLLRSIAIAISSLSKNKGRLFMTIFGITIGIAMVIVVFSAGEGVKGLILGEIAGFGDNWINIEIKVPSTSKNSINNAQALTQGVIITTLTELDADAIRDLPAVEHLYAGVTSQAILTYKNEKKRPTIFGVSPEYILIDQSEVERGRFYNDTDDQSTSQVVVLGYKIANDLFGNEDPIGKNIKVDKKSFQVIGVMEERGVSGFFNYDETVFIPLRTTQKKLLGIDHILWIIAELHDGADAEFVAEEIQYLLRERHNISDPIRDDFAVTTMEESLEIVGTILFGITWLLVALAGISLLVGGVGIMNVMYVSVAERTFEIGLRKSVGASSRDILYQFLIEAITVTTLGGIVGILIGIIISYLISVGASFAGVEWVFHIPPFAVIIGVAFSSLVGLIFGTTPAIQASKLDPVVAMKKE